MAFRLSDSLNIVVFHRQFQRPVSISRRRFPRIRAEYFTFSSHGHKASSPKIDSPICSGSGPLRVCADGGADARFGFCGLLYGGGG